MEKLVVCTCHRIKIESQDNFQDNFQDKFFLRNWSPGLREDGRAGSGRGVERPTDLGFWHIQICHIRSLLIFGFQIYSDMTTQQDLTFKMTHIEAKSISPKTEYHSQT